MTSLLCLFVLSFCPIPPRPKPPTVSLVYEMCWPYFTRLHIVASVQHPFDYVSNGVHMWAIGSKQVPFEYGVTPCLANRVEIYVKDASVYPECSLDGKVWMVCR